MVKLFKSIFVKPADVEHAAENSREREKLTQQEVMEHFDCKRFQGATPIQAETHRV